jgi:hypothetical protein
MAPRTVRPVLKRASEMEERLAPNGYDTLINSYRSFSGGSIQEPFARGDDRVALAALLIARALDRLHPQSTREAKERLLFLVKEDSQIGRILSKSL